MVYNSASDFLANDTSNARDAADGFQPESLDFDSDSEFGNVRGLIDFVISTNQATNIIGLEFAMVANQTGPLTVATGYFRVTRVA